LHVKKNIKLKNSFLQWKPLLGPSFNSFFCVHFIFFQYWYTCLYFLFAVILIYIEKNKQIVDRVVISFPQWANGSRMKKKKSLEAALWQFFKQLDIVTMWAAIQPLGRCSREMKMLVHGDGAWVWAPVWLLTAERWEQPSVHQLAEEEGVGSPTVESCLAIERNEAATRWTLETLLTEGSEPIPKGHVTHSVHVHLQHGKSRLDADSNCSGQEKGQMGW
jgi:hypothetical protein